MAESVATQSTSGATTQGADVLARRAAAKEHLSRLGITAKDWAGRHGYSPRTVYKVLGGHLHGHYGVTNNIAVRLGLKDGEIDPACEPAMPTPAAKEPVHA